MFRERHGFGEEERPTELIANLVLVLSGFLLGLVVVAALGVRRGARPAEDEQDEQVASERAYEAQTRQWLTRLQAMTAGLASAVSPVQVAAVAVDESVDALQANNGGLWLLDEDGTSLDLVHTKGVPAQTQRMFRRLPMDTRTPQTDAIRIREPLWFESYSAIQADYPEASSRLAEHVSEGSVCLPLIVDTRRIGVISIGFVDPRRFSERERAAIVTLGKLCSQALDRARLFQAEKKARGDAERAIRAREELLAIVSHDLRNPLSAALLAADRSAQLAGSDEAGEKIRKNMERIRGSGEQMVRLLEDLLDLAKTEAGHVLSMDLRPQDGMALARQAVAALEPLATARELSLTQNVSDEPCPLLCDGGRIQQVFSNLIGNAIKFTRERGSIVVGAKKIGPEVVFSVADSGTGIPQDQLSHLFDAYWQAKAERRGVGIGLGLSVAKAIVEAHHGRIWVESAEEQGSTFHFALPVLGSKWTSGAVGEPAGRAEPKDPPT